MPTISRTASPSRRRFQYLPAAQLHSSARPKIPVRQAASQEAIKARQELEESEKYVKDRTLNWKQAHFEAADQPTTRLILAIEGAR
jgi:hypothetical protein